jgi:hypothetical protein
MIATSVTYDLVFLIHIIAAVSSLIVLVVMRTSALVIVRGADSSVQSGRFPQRRNWAARLLHILPITGLIMSLSGNSSVSLTKPWIGIGMLCYLLAAAHLEARTLPLERVISEVIRKDGSASPERGRKLVRSIDVLLGLIGVALIAMLVRF